VGWHRNTIIPSGMAPPRLTFFCHPLRHLVGVCLFVWIFSAWGCSPRIGIGQSAVSGPGIRLEEGLSVGQTFLSRHRGLIGIRVFLAPQEKGDGTIRLHLRENPFSKVDLAVAEISLQQLKTKGFHSFTFPPLINSASCDYFFFLEFRGTKGVDVGTAPGDTYLEGALYLRGEAQNLQLAFLPQYDSTQLFLGLAPFLFQCIGILFLGVWLFLIPGWALLFLLGPIRDRLSWAEKTGLAAGLSLALYPLLILWSEVVGIHPGSLLGWVPSGIGLLLILWQNRCWRPGHFPLAWSSWSRSANFRPDIVLIGLMALIFLTRFYVIRTLDMPMYGDSVHHTLIAQLLVDHGGLFKSWEPYVPLRTFTYHFGFHTAVAAMHWSSGLGPARSCIWTGQLLNGLAVIALIPLAIKLGSTRWAGAGALLVGGMLAQMPMFYVNWGRYTQLTGQVILLSAVFIIWTLMEADEVRLPQWIPLWIAISGLSLTHYRVTFFCLFFVGALLLNTASRANLGQYFRRLLLLALGGLLAIPWFWDVFSEKIFKIFLNKMTTSPQQLTNWDREYNAIGSLTNYLPSHVWILMLLVAVWGLWIRRKQTAVILLWWLIVLFSANPGWFGLPGTGAINNFAALIAFYIPAGILGGAALGWLINRYPQLTHQKWPQIIFLLLLTGVSLWGAKERLKDVNLARNPLVTRPDLRAADWIRRNLPAQSVFLVNATFMMNNSVLTGHDAGWWLPLLTGRQITLPPMLYGIEGGPHLNYRQRTNGLYEQIQTRGLTDPVVVNILDESGVSHLYIGQRSGWALLGSLSLDPRQLAVSPWFRPVYHQDRVWIFERRKN